MIAKERPDALFVYPDVSLSSYPRPSRLAEFALKAHLRMMNAFRFLADPGGLMSYGATTSEIYTMAAEQVAKILDVQPPSRLLSLRCGHVRWAPFIHFAKAATSPCCRAADFEHHRLAESTDQEDGLGFLVELQGYALLCVPRREPSNGHCVSRSATAPTPTCSR
jgi:hypothetical protein